MLGKFRENARSWLIQLILFAIVVVFVVSFGAGSRGLRSTLSTNPEWAAQVDGAEVPAVAFKEAYHRYVGQLERYGMTSPEQLKGMKVRETIMTDLEDQELLAQAAKKTGVAVSDEALAREGHRMFSDPATHKFDEEAYKNYINSAESSKSFETRLRREILAQREAAVGMEAIPVSDGELRTALLKRDEAVSIAYVKFIPGDFHEQVQVSPADIDAELKDHAADVQKRFDGTRLVYTDPKAIKARRLFVPVRQDATPAQEQAAKKRIEDAKAALTAGKKWEDLAPEFKDDPVSGGDLGWVQLGRSTVGRSTEEAVFKLKAGQTSDVVRDRFGYEILQALEERAPTEKKFDEVKRDIAADLLRESKQKGMALAAAHKTLEALKAGKPLDQQWPPEDKKKSEAFDPNLALTPHTVLTEEFHPNGGLIPGAGSVPRVSAAAFSLSADKRSPDAVIEDQNAWWVIEVKSRKRADLGKLSDEATRRELRDKVLTEKRGDMRKLWVDQLRKGATIEANPDFLDYDQGRAQHAQPDDM